MKPPAIEDLIAFARKEADEVGQRNDGPGSVAPGIEFLRTYAGEYTSFYEATQQIARDAKLVHTGASGRARRELAALLRSWADYASTGLSVAAPFDVAFRVEAAGDLLEQAEALGADSAVHPAVIVMIAGAALEELIRGLWAGCSVELDGKPSITAYAQALRKAGRISSNDVKELTSLAGTRNDAAHGQFDKVPQELADVFIARVSLFVRQHPGT